MTDEFKVLLCAFIGTIVGVVLVFFKKKTVSDTPSTLTVVENENTKRLELEKKIELAEKKYEEEARKNNSSKVEEQRTEIEKKTEEALTREDKQEAVTTYLEETSKMMRNK